MLNWYFIQVSAVPQRNTQQISVKNQKKYLHHVEKSDTKAVRFYYFMSQLSLLLKSLMTFIAGLEVHQHATKLHLYYNFHVSQQTE
jgi:DNA topoisomerase VI subunit A